MSSEALLPTEMIRHFIFIMPRKDRSRRVRYSVSTGTSYRCRLFTSRLISDAHFRAPPATTILVERRRFIGVIMLASAGTVVDDYQLSVLGA